MEAISEVNTSLDCEDSLALLQALQSEHAGLTNVEDSNSLHYLTVLRAIKASKIEVKLCLNLVHIIVYVRMCVYHVYIYMYMYVYSHAPY